MSNSGIALCVLSQFEPFGRKAISSVASQLVDEDGAAGAGDGTVEVEYEELGREERRKESYFLFDPAVNRARSTGLELAALESSSANHDGELYIEHNTVIWSAGHQVLKRFSATSGVIQAIWCFMESVIEPFLCVLHSDSLATYTPSGEIYSVPLHFSVSSIWCIPSGLLLQRTSDSGIDIAPTPTQSTSSPFLTTRELYRDVIREGAFSGTISRVSPSLHGLGRKTYGASPPPVRPSSSHFTLQHPLEEPEALQVQEAAKFRALTDMDEYIIWTSSSFPYVATYHKGKMQHSLWRINPLGTKSEIGLFSGRPMAIPNCARGSSTGFCLQSVWQDKVVQSQANQVLMVTDEDGVPIVCFVMKDKKRLFALKLFNEESFPEVTGFSTMDIAWSIPAISAVPVVATRSKSETFHLIQYDLLVLAPDGNLFLYVYRCAVRLIQTSEITATCVTALAEGLCPSFYRFFLVSLVECRSEAWNLLETGANGEDPEWSIFSYLIMQWLERCSNCLPEKGTDEPTTAWEFLLQSSMHNENVMSCNYFSFPLPQLPCLSELQTHYQQRCKMESYSTEETSMRSILYDILETLHALYEDHKLDSLRWGELWKLADLLAKVALELQELDYYDHYARDFPTVIPPMQQCFNSLGITAMRSPPNLFKWFEAKITKVETILTDNMLPLLLKKDRLLSCVAWSRKVVGFYELLLGAKPIGQQLPSGILINSTINSSYTAEQRTVLAMAAENFGLSELDRLPPGVSLPLRHALDNCRECPPSDWQADAYVLVGREDLASTCAGRMSSSKKAFKRGQYSPKACMTLSETGSNGVPLAVPYMLHLQPVQVLPSSADPLESYHVEGQDVDAMVNDGMGHVFSSFGMLRFGRDLRLNEVRRLLCSSRPVAVRTTNSPDVSDPDLVAQQQAQLWQLAQRTTALPFGRGAFTLTTLRPLLTEALPIPKLVLAGRLPFQHDAVVNLDVNSGNISDLTSWPEFHNGVAAGLRLAPGQTKITRTWIVYNKPDEPSYAHAGLLMSLGLLKHLGVLAATDVYRYLAQEHEATTVGILLGMASAYRGTMDPAISKMLYLHIPARHPPSFPELELPTLMQSAALMAVGLLYQGSAHRLTTEILLAEIGRKPGGDNALDREGYALAAGLALGLVTLGRGKDAWGLADLMIEDRLRHYMAGGSEPCEDRHRRYDGIMSSNGFLFNASRNLDDLSQGGGQVMEGSMVNLDVTAPGATLALALMFIKTNDEAVASRLAIPDTHFSLEYVRPDFILLRVVARTLIMWDSVRPNEEWVQAQVPFIVKEAMSGVNDAARTHDGILGDVDMEALAQAHVNILAGACLSIALRYAGTASEEAQKLLHRYAMYFLHEKGASSSLAGNNSPTTRRSFVDRGTLETCLNVAVLSLSVVMAGTGHLETFKLLRYLRRRNYDVEGSINYGNHMAVSMAIGFLFLGGGSLTFSTNNGAIAALLIALYPRFPTTPSDHRCHLQAFRHLYVLATEARYLQTVDVDTGMPVYAPVEMTLKETSLYSETSFSRITPCLLPERSSLKRVRICGPRYWLQDISLSPTDEQPWWEHGDKGDPFNGGILYVKRKVGASSYIDDPIGCRSLLSRALHRMCKKRSPDLSEDLQLENNGSSHSKANQLVSKFSADPSLLAFAQLLCSQSHTSDFHAEFEDFCLLALFECVSSDRPALLQTYLALYTAVEGLLDCASHRGRTISRTMNSCIALDSLKIALAYSDYFSSNSETSSCRVSLVQRTFLAALAKRVDDIFVNWKKFQHPPENSSATALSGLVHYLNSYIWPLKEDFSGSVSERMLANDALLERAIFGCYLCWYRIPKPSAIYLAVRQLQEYFPESISSLEVSNMLLPTLALLLPGTPTQALSHLSQCIPFLTYKFL
ncbi:hypothetical protein O6H91_17G058400 [Diphasiastrum complanatum]|uniref:Uncharacterized protein n=1 Tax=Diphasiastrum complanatum TaxID=34168 RepID=A0ACC2B839_DIPCM|nr:hypothetical protein O6H91_17G058400 [Diphasiastrum complanatum]